MRPVSLLILTLATLLPSVAFAIDVDFGARVEAVYDSNVFRTSDDAKQDGSFRFTPTIRIEGANSKFSGDILYEPTYEVFTTYSEANDLTHLLLNSFDWRPTEKTDLTWVNSFQAVDVLNFGNIDTIDEGTTPAPSNDIERERIHLFGSSISVAHAIDPRWDSNTDFSYNLFNAERKNSVDSNSVAGFQAFNYGLTAADRIGGGGGVTAQFFDKSLTLPSSNTFVYQIFATYLRNFGESTTVSIRIGPAAIHTIQDSGSGSVTSVFPANEGDNRGFLVPNANSCVTQAQAGGPLDPVLLEGSRCALTEEVPFDDTLPEDMQSAAWQALNAASEQEVTITGSNSGSNDLRWTVFGEVAVTHLWLPTLSSTLSYNRSENTANGDGGSAIADTVQFSTTWRPSELWDLSFRASYVRRESPNNLSRTFVEVEIDDATGLVMTNGSARQVEVSNNINTHRWAVAARAARRISRRMSASARFSYSDQESAHTGRSPNDFGDFLAVVGIQYDFDPFRF
jgi:hypothetical protein